MEQTPKASVVMSVYKEPLEWLHESIDSILNQTFKDFEFIIICDNPAYKEGLECIEQYKITDKRIKLIINEQNKGLTKSLNKGIKEAIGEYIVRMDADDYSYPQRIERQLQFMYSHPSLVASGCYAEIMNEKGNVVGKMQTSTNIKYLRALFPFRSPIYHPSAIIKRIIDGQPFRYDEEFRYSQDYALWFKLIEKGISNLPDYLIRYRISSNQISSLHSHSMRELDCKIRLNALNKYYVGLSDSDKNLMVCFHYLNVKAEDNKQILSLLKKTSLIKISDIDINESMRFLYMHYCYYLSNYFNLLSSIKIALQAKDVLKIHSYKGVASVVYLKIKKIYKNVQLFFCNKICKRTVWG